MPEVEEAGIRAGDDGLVERLVAALDNTHVVVFAQDVALRYMWIHNPAMGLLRSDVIGRMDSALYEADCAARLTAIKRQVIATGEPVRQVVRTCRAGRIEYQDLLVKPMRDEAGQICCIVGVATDLSRLTEAEEALRLAHKRMADQPPEATGCTLEEARTLVAEAHHRVKNSLAMVEGLLRLERSAADTPEQQRRLSDIEARIHAIGNLHDRLSRTTGDMDFAIYLNGLCLDLAVMHGCRSEDLIVEAEAIEMPATEALHLGMIATELVINALKYGRGAEGAGRVTVGFARAGDVLRLTVADGGAGLPQGFCPEEDNGLGMRIVTSLLAARQGRLRQEPAECGARFVVELPAPPLQAMLGPEAKAGGPEALDVLERAGRCGGGSFVGTGHLEA